jgi:hypothetical protein
VFLNVTLFTGLLVQFGVPVTVNFTAPVSFLPTNRPEVTVPVIVAVVAVAPVPVVNVSEYFDVFLFFHVETAVPVSFCLPVASAAHEPAVTLIVALNVPAPPVDAAGVHADSAPFAVIVLFTGVFDSPGANVAEPVTFAQLPTGAAIAGDALIAVIALAASITASAADTRPRLRLIRVPSGCPTREITLSGAIP